MIKETDFNEQEVGEMLLEFPPISQSDSFTQYHWDRQSMLDIWYKVPPDRATDTTPRSLEVSIQLLPVLIGAPGVGPRMCPRSPISVISVRSL